ncbi:MAG: transposase [Streptosporangiaceae bacterium]|nr:transposase [Streptosporangiaceae bacterium]
MATTLCEANDAAQAVRTAGLGALEPHVLARIRNRYLGALARAHDDNLGKRGPLADEARKLIRRFERHEDMVLRFCTDLRVPFSNDLAERDQRPVKVQQGTSGGCWRTLQGLIDFAVGQSYLSTVGKWGLDKLDALEQLFTTGAWIPPALTPSPTELSAAGAHEVRHVAGVEGAEDSSDLLGGAQFHAGDDQCAVHVYLSRDSRRAGPNQRSNAAERSWWLPGPAHAT